jgi:hypothetical protein
MRRQSNRTESGLGYDQHGFEQLKLASGAR